MKKELLLIEEFDVMEVPEWTCPSCDTGILKKDLTKEKDYNSLTIYDTQWTKNAHRHVDYYPEIDETKFFGYLVCTNCNDQITIYGNGRLEEEYSERRQYFHNILKPLNFNPPLKIINVNRNCPGNVKNIITDSFNLYWLDLPSCANKIRVSIEFLLDHFNAERTITNANGEENYKPLDKRITDLVGIDEKVKEKLMAIKWIGNIGTHEDKMEKKYILHVYEILESLLDDLYNNDGERINRIVRTINESKGRNIE